MSEETDYELGADWEAEIRRRIEAIDRGEVELLDLEEAERLIFGEEQGKRPNSTR